jgi:UDP-glucuronate 4-epimerase
MAISLFTKAILQGAPTKLFNHGRMRRDFTHIDDVSRIVLRLIDHIPAIDRAARAPARIFNVGNQRPQTFSCGGAFGAAVGARGDKEYVAHAAR